MKVLAKRDGKPVKYKLEVEKRTGSKPARGRPRGSLRFSKKTVRDALRATGGFISYAAEKLGCHESTIRKMLKRYPDLKAEIHEIREGHLDMAEHSLLKQVKDGNTKATTFLLDRLGAERGYGANPKQHQHLHAHAGAGSWMDIIKRQITAGKIDRHTGQIVDAEFVEDGKKN